MDYAYKVTKKLKEDKYLKGIFPIEDDETYTKTVAFDSTSSIVKALIGYMNNPKWQRNAGVFNKKQRAKLEKDGLSFEEILTESGEKKYEVIITDEILSDLTAGYLMFDKDGEYKDILYIGSATDSYPYVFFNTKIVDEHIGDIIRALREEHYITKVKMCKKDKE